jgi:hypothetical protein
MIVVADSLPVIGETRSEMKIFILSVRYGKKSL